MAVVYKSLVDLKNGYPGSGVDRPIVAKLIAATVMNYSEVTNWGTHLKTGSCRAGARSLGAYYFGRSVHKVRHAEEELVPQIAANGFDYMYVDIEPCHSGKYGKDGGCKWLIHKTFAAGTVFYAFDQDNYESGMLSLVKENDVQSQVVLLRSWMGDYL